MQGQYDVAVISIFGRCNWLVDQLVKAKKKVILIDVSEEVGRLSPEDNEGPFGFFHSDQIQQSQIERLNEEVYHDPVENGYTLWLKSGPVELKNNLTPYWLKRLNLSSESQDYILNFSQYSRQELQDLRQQIESQPFRENWLAHLAHQIAGNTYQENAKGIREGEPLPLFSPVNIRRVTRKGFEKSLAWCEEKGVKVLTKSSIKDLRMVGRTMESLEVESEGGWSGVVSAEHFVWGLTGEESDRIQNKNIVKKLFRSGVAEPQWLWVRYRVRMSECSPVESLPQQFTVIGDLFLPWTHGNLLVVQRSVSEMDFDVWVKVPNHQRFQKAYIDEILNDVVELLESKIPGVTLECQEMPESYRYEYETLGPPRFPIFDSRELKKRKPIAGKNVFFDSPEQWSRLDWTGRFDFQSKLISQLEGVKA